MTDAEPLVDRLSTRYGFTTDVRHLAVFGHCANCSASLSQPEHPDQAEQPQDSQEPQQ